MFRFEIEMSDNFGNGPEIERDPRRFLAQPSTLLNIGALILAFIIFCCNVSIVDVSGGCIFHAVSTCGFVSFVSCIAWIHGNFSVKIRLWKHALVLKGVCKQSIVVIRDFIKDESRLLKNERGKKSTNLSVIFSRSTNRVIVDYLSIKMKRCAIDHYNTHHSKKFPLFFIGQKIGIKIRKFLVQT